MCGVLVYFQVYIYIYTSSIYIYIYIYIYNNCYVKLITIIKHSIVASHIIIITRKRLFICKYAQSVDMYIGTLDMYINDC